MKTLPLALLALSLVPCVSSSAEDTAPRAMPAGHPAIEYIAPKDGTVIMEGAPLKKGLDRTFTIDTINGQRNLSARDFVDGAKKGYRDTLTFKPKNPTPAQLKSWAIDGIIPGNKYKILYAH